MSSTTETLPKTPRKVVTLFFPHPLARNLSEVKVINKWKNLLRQLQPESKFMKEYIQAEFLLLMGNVTKSIQYCRSAILEFAQIKQLDIMDWVGLITLLINCLIKAEIHDQASYYA